MPSHFSPFSLEQKAPGNLYNVKGVGTPPVEFSRNSLEDETETKQMGK